MPDAIADLAGTTGIGFPVAVRKAFSAKAAGCRRLQSDRGCRAVCPRLIETRAADRNRCQSGGIGFAIYRRARRPASRSATWLALGNESDLGAGDFLNFMVQVPRPTSSCCSSRASATSTNLSPRPGRRGNRQALDCGQDRPFGRRRAGCGIAYRGHGRLVRGLDAVFAK